MAKEAEAIVKATPKHIESVRKKIDEIRKNIAGQFVDLGELLGEIKDGGYHVTWGFQNFGLWLKQSGLDMGESQAYYLIKIIRTAKQLNVPREQLEQIKLSKLREICRLDPKTNGKQIKQLMKACTPDKDGNEMSLEDVRLNVQKVEAGLKDGDDDTKIDLFVFMTIKVTTTAKQNIEDAFELARAKYGNTTDSEGNAVEISNGRALEIICADFLSGTDEVEQEDEHVPVEGEEVGTRVDMSGEQKALPPAPDDLPCEVGDPATEEVTVAYQLPMHVGEKAILPTGEVIEGKAVVGDVERAQTLIAGYVPDAIDAEIVLPNPVNAVVGEVKDAEFKVENQEATVVNVSKTEAPVEAPPIHVLNVDVKAVEQRVAADLSAKNDEQDPLFDEAKAIMEAEFNEDTSPAVGALTLQRRFRIGTARALKLFQSIREAN